MTSLPDPSETPQRPDPPADGAVRGEDENVGTEQHAPSAPDAPAQPERAQSGHDASTTTATAAVSAAASWLSRVGHNVRDYATAAGKQFDRAADSINDTVDHMTQQVCALLRRDCARQGAVASEFERATGPLFARPVSSVPPGRPAADIPRASRRVTAAGQRTVTCVVAARSRPVRPRPMSARPSAATDTS